MLIRGCDSPPPSYTQVMHEIAHENAIGNAVSPLRSFVFSEEWCVRNSGHERPPVRGQEGVNQRQQSIRRAAASKARVAFTAATILRACPPLNKLDMSIRYHFGIRPVSYAALADAVEVFVGRLTDYGAMLSSHTASGGRSVVEASHSADLLSAMHALDVQYGIWETIIRESREPILRPRRAQCGRDGANPFVAIRRDLQLVQERVMGCSGESSVS